MTRILLFLLLLYGCVDANRPNSIIIHRHLEESISPIDHDIVWYTIRMNQKGIQYYYYTETISFERDYPESEIAKQIKLQEWNMSEDLPFNVMNARRISDLSVGIESLPEEIQKDLLKNL